MNAEGKRLLIVGGGNEAVELLESARRMGFSVRCINSPSRYREEHGRLAEHVALTDLANVPSVVAIARALRDAVGVDAVISLTEESLVAAAHVVEALGVRGSRVATVEALKDKVRMRELLAKTGVSPVKSAAVRDESDIRAFFERVGGPIVVKPANGASSLGIYRVAGAADVRAAAEGLAALGVTEAIAEEYLDGPEVSVEAFSFEGDHVILAVTDKSTLPNHVELAHCTPSGVDAATREQLEAVTRALLDAVGLSDGPSHTEIKLTSRGPRIIESHNRVGGDRINELVRVAYGVDMKALAMAWSAGLPVRLEAAPQAQRAAAIRFLVAEPGRVRAVVNGLEGEPAEGVVEWNVRARVGQTVQAVASSSDRLGHVLVSASSAEAASRRCAEIAGRVRIETVNA